MGNALGSSQSHAQRLQEEGLQVRNIKLPTSDVGYQTDIDAGGNAKSYMRPLYSAQPPQPLLFIFLSKIFHMSSASMENVRAYLF